MDLNNYVVQIRKGTKRITLQRFLCSKIAHGKDFTLAELAAVFHNQLWLQTKCSTDIHFQSKFGGNLELLTDLLKEANFSRGLQGGAVKRLRAMLNQQQWDFLYPERNLPQIEAKIGNSIVTKWRKPLGVETKLLPPKKYIGRGYRDHGTAQRPEADASPAWQEVASEVSNLERKLQELKDDISRENINKGNALTVLKALKEALTIEESLGRITNSSRNSRTAKTVTEDQQEN